jgi:hypothetical protein
VVGTKKVSKVQNNSTCGLQFLAHNTIFDPFLGVKQVLCCSFCIPIDLQTVQMVQNKPTPHKYRPERYKTIPHHTYTVLKKSVSSTMWASFKCVFVSEHLSFVSYHHADFSYPWHLFHTQMSFFHTLCNIFIPFWYN